MQSLRPPCPGACAHAPKSVANLFGIVHGCFQQAVYEAILSANPCVLPPGTISTKVTTPRYPYSLEEVHRLTSEPVPWDQLVLNALRFYAGLREGEACGRRFLHWDRKPKPLGSLLVNTQFDDRPLKTSNHQKDRVRNVPVHPELERILDAWWNEHFETIYGRKPKRENFIVPRRLRRRTKDTYTNHTNSTAGKSFNATCLLVDVTPHTEHAARHTMISECRNNGAPEDVLEQVTHNKKGTIVDAYTLWKWEPLCKAVMAFPMRNGKPALEQLEDPQQRALHAKLDVVLQALGGLQGPGGTPALGEPKSWAQTGPDLRADCKYLSANLSAHLQTTENYREKQVPEKGVEPLT
ncbi:hypothetical protein [Pendulispora albinea]|uniref:Uncharacterized protein n=1 Tax=Pendulispora albinea TaxID=2741071 RepID=A0ABZ2LP39_9BACT